MTRTVHDWQDDKLSASYWGWIAYEKCSKCGSIRAHNMTDGDDYYYYNRHGNDTKNGVPHCRGRAPKSTTPPNRETVAKVHVQGSVSHE